MKKKILFFSIGVVSILSCAAAMSFSPKEKIVKADGVIDLGEIHCTFNSTHATWNSGLYLNSDETNEMAYDWSNRMYSTELNSVIYNGQDLYQATGKRIHICKHEAKAYYLSFGDYGLETRTEGDTVTIQGNWTSTMKGKDYTLYINPITVTWTENHWVQQFIVPELEVYDKISLNEIASDDYDRVPFDTEAETSGWNTFAASEENTTNSFVFEFLFESYSVLDRTLDIRFCGDGTYDSNHFYQLSLNNTWGGDAGGVIVFNEKAKTTIVHGSGDHIVNLRPGARHTIECASIVVKNSIKVYNYVKFDGEYLYRDIFTPQTSARTPRVGMCYGANNIFVGGTTEQKTTYTDVFTFDHSNGNKGVFLTGPENDIPYLDDWSVRGAPASKYNMIRNGEIFYPFTANNVIPLIKYGINQYYISFDDYNLTFQKGDVISFGGEFHFYANNKGYVMNIAPFSVKFNGTQFEVVENLDDYLSQAINEYVELDCYDTDQQTTITGIIQTTIANVIAAKTIKAKWGAFNEGKASLDAIPMNPTKLQEYKEAAIAQLNDLVDETKYEAAELAIIQGYIDAAIVQINSASSVKEIRDIIEDTKAKIAGVTTKQDAIEQRILALEDGYEQYLATSEVITTSDICAIGDITFYPKDDSEHESYSSVEGPDSVYGRFATKPENEYGNVTMKFKYQSTNPKSCKYQSQVFVRLRGTAASCYLFDIAMNNDGQLGVGLSKFVSDVKTEVKTAPYNFVANTEYDIECGAIDLQNYDRTFLFMKINGNYVLKSIVDRHGIDILAPTVLFFDCHTADGSGETVTLSPSEVGTTKNDLAASVGRLVLDNKSSSESLVATMRNNSIPVGAKLYPMQTGAYLYNGNEMNDYRASALITKTADKKYTISLPKSAIENNDTIKIGGVYAYYDTDTNIKTIYKLADTTFTYIASSNSWSQSAPTLAEAKQEAIDYLNDNVSLAVYSSDNQAVVQALLDDYIARINNATTNEEVEQLLNSALREINNVPTLLSEYKASAKAELTAYKSPSIYRDAEKAELNTILNNAFARIDACNDVDSVDYIVLVTKQDIDALKTAAEYDVEELASEKRLAKTEIETYIGLVELNRYTDENAAKIQQLAMQARNDVDNATTIEEARNIVSTFKEAIKNVSTKDGSTFDGNKYNEKAKGGGGCHASIEGNSSIIFLAAILGLGIAIRQIYKIRKEEN